jgi:hypothetical protein
LVVPPTYRLFENGMASVIPFDVDALTSSWNSCAVGG